MKATFRNALTFAAASLVAVGSFAEETAAGGGHEQLTHVNGIPIIAIVGGVLGALTVVALIAGVVSGYLTSREDWPHDEH